MIVTRHSMVPPTSPTSARRAGLPTRSKAGCLTCKAKHLKCDETRPACLRCSQKGLQCGGYWQGVRWSFKHQPELAPQAFQTQEYARPSSSQPRRVSGAPDTKQAQRPVGDKDTAATFPPKPGRSSRPAKRQKSRTSSVCTEPSLSTSVESTDSRQNDRHAPLLAESDPGQSSSQVVLSAAAPSAAGGMGGLAISDGLLDKSSAFIINWFENVCPAWSGFDSSYNPCRKIATDHWRNSITVCSSLESMSAAFMASRNPNMRQPALRLMKQATDYVQMELHIVKSQPQPQAIPTGLLFSLFGLGTTICWVDPRGLGLPFFKEANLLLDRLNQQQPAFSDTVDTEQLAFFNRCMTYCNMLLAVVHDDDDDDGDAFLSGALPGDFHSQALLWPGFGGEAAHETPHPWTGISSTTSRLFAESVRLCRKFRRRSRSQLDSRLFFSVPVQDFRAELLEEKLLDLEISPDGGISDTGDNSTPSSHLALVAEAYRLASLLHLYQTFPNLVYLRLPDRSLPADDETVLWREWIIPLSLHLVKVLERIPPTSGSRVIQPLLYISASTGLRQLQTATPAYTPALQSTLGTGMSILQPAQGPANVGREPANAMDIPLLQNPDNLSSYISHLMGDGNELLAPATPNPDAVADMSLDVSSARHFIMQRLSILESSLPPTPVAVAKELVSAIWRAYDHNPPGLLPVHWIDVMEANDLRSMFG